MFQLYHHHDLGRLAELLGALLENTPAGPLRRERVLVPNQGVQRWLQKELAENRGVLANVEFPLPAGFIWGDVIRDSLGYRNHEAYARDSMVWHLYRLLPGLADDHPAMARYLAGEPREVHRLQLAERLADVFDQYQVFRGDMLMAWDGHAEERESVTAAWQAPVWRALVAALGEEHRVRTLREVIGGLQEGTLEVALPTGRVFVFGVGDLPPDYLRFLYALGRQQDVHLLLPNPSEVYWGDAQAHRVSVHFPLAEEDLPGQAAVEAGHPLLASLGRPTRDFLHLLYSDELIAIQEPALGQAMDYAPPTGDSLLARLQRGMIRLDATPEKDGKDENDISLQIHACHGPLREVQVLHDQLLDLLARDQSLEPREIVVMLPKLTDYAPAIRSVFGSAGGRAHIPWSLSDQPRRASHPIVQTFLDLLALPVARWSASHIMNLVAVPAIMRRFGLDEADLASLQHWVAAAGIRWGLDADTRERRGAGRYDQNSWRFGLDRLLLGSMLADEEQLVDDVAPWSDLEGNAADTLGRLHEIVDHLATWQATLEQPARAADWHDRFNRLLERLFAIDPEDSAESAAIEAIHEGLAVLETADRALGDTPIDWLAVREALGNALAESGQRQPFLSGGVTFCSLQSLAGLPFRVVCLLGMNDGDFPRQDGGREFNLILHRRHLGDRANRDSDRLAFLQALLAAGEVFYLSYTGTDVRSGEPLEPAATAGEFMDFLHRHHFHGWSRADFVARLITRQPMQPFSRRYFERQRPARIFTFRDEWAEGSRARPDPEHTAPGLVDDSRMTVEDDDIIELAALRYFFREPARVFLEQQLGVKLDQSEDQLADDEAFALDALSSAVLRAQLFDQVRREDRAVEEDQPPRLWQRRGVLPPPPLATGAWAGEARAVNALLPVAQDWQQETTAGVIDTALTTGAGEVRLVGRISEVHSDGLYRIRPGKLKLKHLLPHWVDYLALKAAGQLDDEAALHVAGLDGEEPDLRRARVDCQTAVRLLVDLVNEYREGLGRPLPFHAELAEAYLADSDKHLKKDGDAAGAASKALEALNNKLDPGHFQPHYLVQDPYLMTVLDTDAPLGADPDTSEFCRLADTVCRPLHEAMEAATEAGRE